MKRTASRLLGRQRQVNPVLAAVNFVPGGATAISRSLGVSRAAVYRWIDMGRVAKVRSAKALSELSGVPVDKLLKGN